MKVKVKNAKSLPHYKHDLNHDVSTSFDWGHMQPLMVRELPAQSNCTLRTGQIVRLMSMVLPTFGRITLNTYNVFVPMESIFHPYASLRAGQTYMGANSTYIPRKVISCMPLFWNLVCKELSEVTMWTIDEQDVVENSDGFRFDLNDCSRIVDDMQAEFIEYLAQSYVNWLFNDVSNLGVFGADYLLKYTKYSTVEPDTLEGYDWVDIVNIGSGTYQIVAGKYLEAARNLRKVLYGCGYKCVDDGEYVSMLPLMAYYKAYFDLFYPQRDITWKDTPAAGLQEWCEQNGLFEFDSLDGFAFQKPEITLNFIKDLCETYYTQSPDFVSAHITGQRISTVPNQRIDVMDALGVVNGSVQTPYGPHTAPSIGDYALTPDPVASNVKANLLNANNIDLLMRLTHRINAATVIGGDIRAFLKTQLGADYLDEDETYWIGSQKLDISVAPVFSNAETEQGFLGEFAGQGMGGTQGEIFKYETKVDGFWVCMAAIVPDSRFAQGMDMNLKHIGRNDFYDPMTDSVTLLPTPKKYIYAEFQFGNRLINAGGDYQEEFNDKLNASFGNIPNGIEYCVAQNIVNGDMSLRSRRDSYLPFTLDKLLPYSTETQVSGISVFRNLSLDLVVNSTIWRYIGLYKWIGNYNRIFNNSGRSGFPTGEDEHRGAGDIYSSTGYDDNFIGHNYLDFKVWNTKLPVRDSFQTGAFDEGSISLEKA